jgi:hypothetical protein
MTLPAINAFALANGTTLAIEANDFINLYVSSYSYLVKIVGASGTFTLSFGGQTTSPITLGASAATVQSALVALSSIGSSSYVTVVCVFPYVVTISPLVSGTLTVNGAGLSTTGSTPSTAAGSGSTIEQYLAGYASAIGPGWSEPGANFGQTFYTVASGSGVNQLTATFTGLPAGNYQLFGSFNLPSGSSASLVQAAKFYFFDGSTFEFETLVDLSSTAGQVVGPSSNNYFPISTHVTSSGSITIIVTDEVTGSDIGKSISIQSLLIVPANPTAGVVLDQTYQGNGTVGVLSGTGGIVLGDGWGGQSNGLTTAGSKYGWNYLCLAPGTYNWQADWIPFFEGHQYGPFDDQAGYQFFDGPTQIGPGVIINQNTNSAGGVTVNDPRAVPITFRSFGNFPITGTQFQVIQTASSHVTGSVYTLADAGYLALVSYSARSVPSTSATVSTYTTGPVALTTARLSSGNPIPLTSALWSQGPIVNVAGPNQSYSQQMTFELPFQLISTDVITISISNSSLTLANGVLPGGTYNVTNKVGSRVSPATPTNRTLGGGMNTAFLSNVVPVDANLFHSCAAITYPNSSNTPDYPLNSDGYYQFRTSGNTLYSFGTSGSVPTDPKPCPNILFGNFSYLFDSITSGIAAGSCVMPQYAVGTTAAFVSQNTGQITNNLTVINLGIDGSGASYGPQLNMLHWGGVDWISSLDTGRFSITNGTWSTHTGSGWNGGYRLNSKLTSDKATAIVGPLPAGTWTLRPTWVQSAGNTTAAVYTIKENGTQIGQVTYDQTQGAGATFNPDLQGTSIGFANAYTFTPGGGNITVELTGGTDGFCCANCLQIQLTGTVTATPFIHKFQAYDSSIANPLAPPEFHPNSIAADIGVGSIGCRTMDLGGNDGGPVDLSDYPPDTQVCWGNNVSQRNYTVTQIKASPTPYVYFTGQGFVAAQIALLTLTAQNGAKLPIATGTNFFPDLTGTLTNSATVTFGGNETCYYDPGTMSTNQVAVVTKNTIPGGVTIATQTPPGGTVLSTACNVIPPAKYFRYCAAIGATDVCINVPPTASTALIQAFADLYCQYNPVGTKCHFDTADEWWNFQLGFPSYHVFFGYSAIQGLSPVSAGTGYAKMNSANQAIFYAQLQTHGRGNELIRTFNGQYGDTSRIGVVTTWLNAQSPAPKLDEIVFAPYIGQSQVEQIGFDSIYANITAAQSCECLDASLVLDKSFTTTMALYTGIAAAQAATQGSPCELGCYEGNLGFALGPLPSIALNTIQRQAYYPRYHPLAYGVMQGYLTLLQQAGVKAYFFYQRNQLPSEASNLGVYNWTTSISAIIGYGDGSDGKHNNLPDIAGAPPGTANQWLGPSPIAAAFRDWHGVSPVPPTPGVYSLRARARRRRAI